MTETETSQMIVTAKMTVTAIEIEAEAEEIVTAAVTVIVTLAVAVAVTVIVVTLEIVAVTATAEMIGTATAEMIVQEGIAPVPVIGTDVAEARRCRMSSEQKEAVTTAMLLPRQNLKSQQTMARRSGSQSGARRTRTCRTGSGTCSWPRSRPRSRPALRIKGW